MIVKAKQNFYSVNEDRLVNVGEEFEVKDELGQELVDAGYAEEVIVEEQPKKVARKKAGEDK